MGESQGVKELLKQNKELKELLEKNKEDYVWGLTPVDYALAKYEGSPDLDRLSASDYYSTSEVNTDDLIKMAIKEMATEDIELDGWSEIVSNMQFSEELTKILITLALRNE